jgi:adenylate kinase family enzyme
VRRGVVLPIGHADSLPTRQVMTTRLLGRNEGRSDDNIDTIKKRFVTFQESSMPVISFYESLGYARHAHTLGRLRLDA